MDNRRIINKREIPEMEKKIKELIIAEGSDETGINIPLFFINRPPSVPFGTLMI